MSGFELPQHGLEEECVDEYAEEIDSKGQLIRREIPQEDPNVPRPAMNLHNPDFKDACKAQTYFNAEGRKLTKLTARKSSWVHNLITLNGKKFSFDGRKYLMPIYDAGYTKVLLLCGRQVEKSLTLDSKVLLSDGSMLPAGDIKIGLKLPQLNPEDNEVVEGEVVWVSHRYYKDCVKITTESGKCITVALTHPMRKPTSWCEAGDLKCLDSLVMVDAKELFAREEVIFRLEFVGYKECIDFEVTPHHNFIAEGFVTHNSTFLANELVITSAIQPFYKTLYVSPSHIQTRQFSSEKLKAAMEGSHLINRYLKDSRVSDQVFEKGFTNGSMIFLRSCYLSADRSRGISAHKLAMDEVQDILMSNVPVITQCLSHADNPIQLYTGTPKSFDNTAQLLWDNTTQNEWMVPCSHCASALGKKWNYLDVKNIGIHGPICKYCGAPLDVTQGQWQRAKTDTDFQGFRISQLMVPWIAGTPDKWKELLFTYNTYPESQFYNEVLGLSYDNASKPITRADVLMNCYPDITFFNPEHLNPTNKLWRAVSGMNTFAGVDWGEGNDGAGKDVMGKIKTASYTVLTIGAHVSTNKFRVLFVKRYKGKEVDPDFVVKDIVRTCKLFNVRMIGMDWGHGWGVNNQIFRMYGPTKCVQFMYVDRQKEVRKWDPIGYKFQLLRNHVMSELFFQFKDQRFMFPPLNHWEDYAKDIFNVSVEYIEYQRKIRYVHRPSDPDDFCHSLLYCKQVCDIYYGVKGPGMATGR